MLNLLIINLSVFKTVEYGGGAFWKCCRSAVRLWSGCSGQGHPEMRVGGFPVGSGREGCGEIAVADTHFRCQRWTWTEEGIELDSQRAWIYRFQDGKATASLPNACRASALCIGGGGILESAHREASEPMCFRFIFCNFWNRCKVAYVNIDPIAPNLRSAKEK